MLMLNPTPTLTLILTLKLILSLPWTKLEMITLALSLCHRRYHRKSNCHWSTCRITIICSVTTDLDDEDVGPVHKWANHAPKVVSDCDSDPFLIWKPDFTLCEFTQSSFKWEKKALYIVIHLESLILRTCGSKALSERDSCVCVLEMRAEAIHGSISAAGTKYYLTVHRSSVRDRDGSCKLVINAHSSNNEPNQEADRDLRRLSDRDSLLREQAHYINNINSPYRKYANST